MALTVRPDDEVYQFDTVWLGPDEYTLPIQARYVAWGTWLACFLIAAAVLIPIGGHGPGGVLGSAMWSVAVSVVAARAVMLVVDHERPLRSLPQLFSAEARAALASSRGGERALLVRPNRVRVRDVPEKVLRRRDRERRAAERRAERKANRRGGRAGQRDASATQRRDAAPARSPECAGPARSGALVPYHDWDEPAQADQHWMADQGPPPYGPGGYEPAPAYGIAPAYGVAAPYGVAPAYDTPPGYDLEPPYDLPPGYDPVPGFTGRRGYPAAGYDGPPGYDSPPGYDIPAYDAAPVFHPRRAQEALPIYDAPVVDDAVADEPAPYPTHPGGFRPFPPYDPATAGRPEYGVAARPYAPPPPSPAPAPPGASSPNGTPDRVDVEIQGRILLPSRRVT